MVIGDSKSNSLISIKRLTLQQKAKVSCGEEGGGRGAALLRGHWHFRAAWQQGPWQWACARSNRPVAFHCRFSAPEKGCPAPRL